jgi:hypothetical protein
MGRGRMRSGGRRRGVAGERGWLWMGWRTAVEGVGVGDGGGGCRRLVGSRSAQKLPAGTWGEGEKPKKNAEKTTSGRVRRVARWLTRLWNSYSIPRYRERGGTGFFYSHIGISQTIWYLCILEVSKTSMYTYLIFKSGMWTYPFFIYEEIQSLWTYSCFYIGNKIYHKV